jgi:hypothetical protein
MLSSNFKCIKKRATIVALIEAIAIAINRFTEPKSCLAAATVITVRTVKIAQTIKYVL